jgi:hypothetical protein
MSSADEFSVVAVRLVEAACSVQAGDCEAAKRHIAHALALIHSRSNGQSAARLPRLPSHPISKSALAEWQAAAEGTIHDRVPPETGVDSPVDLCTGGELLPMAQELGRAIHFLTAGAMILTHLYPAATPAAATYAGKRCEYDSRTSRGFH